MQSTTWLVVGTFLAVYIGMALGRWPGLKIDRTGIAVLGAIVLYSSGAVSNAEVLQAVDFPTLIVLFGLRVLSAQFGAFQRAEYARWGELIRAEGIRVE